MERRCGTCHHIDQANLDDIFCRWLPPAIVLVKEGPKVFYPSVHPRADRCGQHETEAEYEARKRVAHRLVQTDPSRMTPKK